MEGGGQGRAKLLRFLTRRRLAFSTWEARVGVRRSPTRMSDLKEDTVKKFVGSEDRSVSDPSPASGPPVADDCGGIAGVLNLNSNSLRAEVESSKQQCEMDGKVKDTCLKRGELRPDRCHFYLERKRRYCRTIPPDGQQYCVEHLSINSHSPDTVVRKRIKCPLDPKHTCYENHLQKHLRKCNARPNAQPIYYEQCINAGEIEDGEGIVATVRTVDAEEVKSMVQFVNRLYDEKVGELKKEIFNHKALKEEIENPQNGAPARKHLLQQASLIGHIQKLGLLKDGFCHIEFGAGKGGLSHWVQRALDSCENTKFLLVEKSSIRYKMDVFHKGENQGPEFERLRVDIEHLNLNKVPTLADNKRPIVGLGKHLCGGATDLMLRCLMQTVDHQDEIGQEPKHVQGIVVALCCHHRCDWKSFVAKEIMRDWGVGPREFSLLTSITSWATCATRTFLNKLKDDEEGNSEEEHENSKPKEEEHYQHPKYGSMTPEYREEVGFKCKKLIDLARVQYLRDHGFSADLIIYTEPATTLENVVLVATKPTPNEGNSTEERLSDLSAAQDG